MLFISQSSKVSIGLIIAIITIVGGSFAWSYGAINGALDNEDTRIAVMEATVFNEAAEIHETKGKVDQMSEQLNQLSHK